MLSDEQHHRLIIPSPTAARFEQPVSVPVDQSTGIARHSGIESAYPATFTPRRQSVGLTRSPAICYSSVRSFNPVAAAELRPRRASVSTFIGTPHQDRRATYHSSSAIVQGLVSLNATINPRHSVSALPRVGPNRNAIHNQGARCGLIDVGPLSDPREQPESVPDDRQRNHKDQSWVFDRRPGELHIATRFDRLSSPAALQQGLTHEVRILITQDFDLCYIIHLPRMISPASIFDKIYNKLNIRQQEQADWNIFRVSGSEPVGTALDPQRMWEQCEAAANHHTLFMYLVLPCDPQIISGQLGRFLDQPESSLGASPASRQSSLAPRYTQSLSVSPSDQHDRYEPNDEPSSPSPVSSSWSSNIQNQHVPALLPSSPRKLNRRVSFQPNLAPIAQVYHPSPPSDRHSGCETPEQDRIVRAMRPSQRSPSFSPGLSSSPIPPQLIDDSATESSTADYSTLPSPYAIAPALSYGSHSWCDLDCGYSLDRSSVLRASPLATQPKKLTGCEEETRLNERQQDLVCDNQNNFLDELLPSDEKNPMAARNPVAGFVGVKPVAHLSGGTPGITEQKNISPSESSASLSSTCQVDNCRSNLVDKPEPMDLKDNPSLQVSPEVSWLGILMEDSFQSDIGDWPLMGDLRKLNQADEDIIQRDSNSDLNAISSIETSNLGVTNSENPTSRQSRLPQCYPEVSDYASTNIHADSEEDCSGLASRFDDVDLESDNHSVSSTFQVPMEMRPTWDTKARNEELLRQVDMTNAYAGSKGSSIDQQTKGDSCPDYVLGHTSDDDLPKEVRFDHSEKTLVESNKSSGIPSSNPGWAPRPAIEKVYENLEKSFPNHDLDEPIEIMIPNLPPFPPNKKPSENAKAFSVIKRVLSIRSSIKERIYKAGEGKGGQPKPNKDNSHGVLNVSRNSNSSLPPVDGIKLWDFTTEEVLPGKKSDACSNSSEISLARRGSSSSLKWVKGELIGSGSFGKVYLAFNLSNQGMMAVKQVKVGSQVPPNLVKSPLQLLKSEVCFLKGLEHPNIVQYLGCEETPNKCDIFLEYVPGGSIGSCISKYGRLESEVAKSFTLQILQGLAYLHDSCILHRDLKTDNILVDFNGRCKISDFGLSTRSHEPYRTHLNTSMQGTIFTMAPEVFTRSDRCRYSAKADIWSLGCVVLEMLGGSRAWAGLNAMQIIYKVCVEGRAPFIPEEIQADKYSHHFVKKCLEIAPVSRPTANKLIDHLFVQLDPLWTFEMSQLYRSVNNLEDVDCFKSDQ